MFHTISKSVITYAVKNNYLDTNKADEYTFGLEMSLSVFISSISILTIGLILSMLWETVLFLFLYTLIRRFAGGFHFNSQAVCYLSMCIISLIVLTAIKYINGNILQYSLIMIISTTILIIISPVASLEKPVDEKETIIFGRIARLLIIIIDIMYIVFSFFECTYIAKIVSITLFVITIFSILGKIKYTLYKNTKAAS